LGSRALRALDKPPEPTYHSGAVFGLFTVRNGEHEDQAEQSMTRRSGREPNLK
jgi:hypothetical protein